MLSPREDEDDDTHLCIKCNATLVGLDNYIKHRKERCGKNKGDPKPDLSTIDSLDPTYSLGADVFFQSLELQSSVKKTSLSRLTPPIPISKSNLERKSLIATTSQPRMSPLETNLRGEDWIGGHTLRISGNEDNQTKLINAVASISGNVKKETSTSYTIGYNDYKGVEESEESEVSEDDEEEEHTSGKWKPPPNYTGGKWRPDSPEHDWDDQEQEQPPSWKSLLPEVDRDDDYDAPPPGHTKGKWVPGANEKTQIMQPTIQTKGFVQYWCGPCNRRLGSRAIYDKHLRSSLHLKKVLPEHELEFSGHLEPIKMTEKRVTRPSKFVDGDIYSQVERKKRQKKDDKEVNQVKKRKRKSIFINCPGCKSRVREHLMGKHLISHYHFRKAAGVTNSVYQQLILDNIDAIVHQSPFQCSPCKYYTNWIPNFMQHWKSEEHKAIVDSIEGVFWCSFCKFDCESCEEMITHLSSSDHNEVVAVMNRSMPIIIRKKTIFKCETCSEVFRYNMELKKHCEKTGHAIGYTATDNYQELHKCQLCRAKFKTSITLAAHLKSRHRHKSHLCMVCSLTFKSAEEAKQHRQTTEHMIKRIEMLNEKGIKSKDLRKKCPYCPGNVMLKNILVLKEHIRARHPDIKKTCPKCGMEFVLSQEVSSHIKYNACQFQGSSRINSSVFWSCSQCLFATDSKAECFFHEVLHKAPKSVIIQVGDTKKVIQQYSCPICEKMFKKSSLREHLRLHTFERPFTCHICSANFTRQTSLANHVKAEHGDDVQKLPKLSSEIDEWSCEKCLKSFTSKSLFTRHSCKTVLPNEDRKCDVLDCSFVAATPLQLTRHKRKHGIYGEQRHKCPYCDFKCSQSSNMKRHMVYHKGEKPYFCPHCTFFCSGLENLRKHVLKTGRHKDVFLYLCKHCDYKTNMAKDLRSHLTDTHSDLYNPKSAMEAVKNHLMNI